VKTFVRRTKVIQIVVEYNILTLMPLLVATFQFQNLSIKPLMVDDASIFGAMISNEITLHELLENELALFQHLHVKPPDCLLL
jgi:hypothetical protein